MQLRFDQAWDTEMLSVSDRKHFLSAIVFSLVSLHFLSGQVAAIKLLLLGKKATLFDEKVS
jgi:hypothetical protein